MIFNFGVFESEACLNLLPLQSAQWSTPSRNCSYIRMNCVGMIISARDMPAMTVKRNLEALPDVRPGPVSMTAWIKGRPMSRGQRKTAFDLGRTRSIFALIAERRFRRNLVLAAPSGEGLLEAERNRLEDKERRLDAKLARLVPGLKAGETGGSSAG
jgi:hypothetical protein